MKAGLNYELLSLLLEHSILSLKEVAVPKEAERESGLMSKQKLGCAGWLPLVCLCEKHVSLTVLLHESIL